MKSIFTQDSRDNSAVVTSGIADLMTSLAVIFILLLVAYVTRVHDVNADPAGSRTAPADMTPSFDPSPSPLETKRPSVHTVTVPDAAINFEFGKSALLPAAETFLSEVMPHYASITCQSGGQEVEAFVIEGYTDDLGDDIRNLRLSQDRSFAVLAKSLEVIREKLPWAYECFLQKATANGRGKQNLLRNDAGHLDRDKSRRVIFKIHMRPA
ncbi:MAG TPA: OmpA family protein [Nitrospira sp.]|nr:OmpA family protein [Nitrospira sp.]